MALSLSHGNGKTVFRTGLSQGLRALWHHMPNRTTSREAQALRARGRGVWFPAIAVWLLLLACIDVSNVIGDLQGDASLPWVLPVIWEYSSWLAYLTVCWLPWLAFRLAPPARGTPWPAYGLQALAIALFWTSHVALFLGLRVLAYWLFWGGRYTYAHNLLAVLFELPKDVLAYGVLTCLFVAAKRYARRPPPAPATFDIRQGARLIRIATVEILAVSAAGNYVEFVLRDGRRPLMRVPLSAIEAALAPHGFVRTHRSWLVNPAAVTGLEPEGSGDWRIELAAVHVPLSRRFPEALKKLRGVGSLSLPS